MSLGTTQGIQSTLLGHSECASGGSAVVTAATHVCPFLPQGEGEKTAHSGNLRHLESKVEPWNHYSLTRASPLNIKVVKTEILATAVYGPNMNAHTL